MKFLFFLLLMFRLTASETCIRVGEGTVAPLHQQKLSQHEITTLGVIDTDNAKKQIALQKGFAWFESYDQAFLQRPDFWDICVPPEVHLAVIKKIMEIDPEARLLVEKPICMSDQIQELSELLEKFQGKLVINENYLSSEITDKVLKIAFDTYHLTPRRIVVEMDKNRTADIKRGRYVDPEGAFKYEGTHMLTILQAALDKLQVELPNVPHTLKYEPLVLQDRSLANQGSADIQFTLDNLEVHLFSSMNGRIKNPYPPYNPDRILETETGLRYRILAIEGESPDGTPYTVVGFYEPLAGHSRSIGEVVLLKNGELVKSFGKMVDDSMGHHLGRAADYLLGKRENNPCCAEKGIKIVQLLDRMLPPAENK